MTDRMSAEEAQTYEELLHLSGVKSYGASPTTPKPGLLSSWSVLALMFAPGALGVAGIVFWIAR